jgi:hypothetical protein
MRAWILLLATACASPQAEAPRSAVEPDATAEPPFSAAEIRDATRPGRAYRFSVEAEGETAYFQQVEFIAVTEEGTRMRASMFDFDGNIKGEPIISELTWQDLEAHATWPLAATRVSDTTTDTPAGRFDCWLYTVTEGDTITRAYFAKGLPGAPVRYEQERRGTIIFNQTLVDYREP